MKPVEVSSKKPVGRKRKIVDTQTGARDPRFDPLCGHFNEDLFRRSYMFLGEKQLEELEILKQELKKCKDQERKLQLQQTIHSIQSRVDAQKQKNKRVEIKRKVQKIEKARVEQGKKPFHLKQKDLKTLELVDKYKEIKDVDKFLESKRQKNKQKLTRIFKR
jgi:ribosomal RNA-processing protein 36